MTFTAALDAVSLKYQPDIGDIVSSFPNGKIVRYKANECVITRGQFANGFIMVLRGELQVRLVSENGFEINIHSIKHGECSDVNCNSLLAIAPCVADVVAAVDSEVWTVQKKDFQNLMNQSELFRNYVYKCVECGMSQMTQFLEDVTCVRIEKRLARLILDWQNDQRIVEHTHSEIASNIGTAREVVSRNLKIFEKRGCVELHRGYILIRDEGALKNITLSD